MRRRRRGRILRIQPGAGWRSSSNSGCPASSFARLWVYRPTPVPFSTENPSSNNTLILELNPILDYGSLALPDQEAGGTEARPMLENNRLFQFVRKALEEKFLATVSRAHFPSLRANSRSARRSLARSTACSKFSTRKPFSPSCMGVEGCLKEITGIPDAIASNIARLWPSSGSRVRFRYARQLR